MKINAYFFLSENWGFPWPSVPNSCKLTHSPLGLSAIGLNWNTEIPEKIKGVHEYRGLPTSYGKKLNSICVDSSYNGDLKWRYLSWARESSLLSLSSPFI